MSISRSITNTQSQSVSAVSKSQDRASNLKRSPNHRSQKNASDCSRSVKKLRIDTEPTLMEATKKGNLVAIQVLLARGATVNRQNQHGISPLHLAAGRGYTEIVQALLTAGATVNQQDQDLTTPLHFAARHGYAEAAQALLTAGASTNVKDSMDTSPLYEAVESGDIEIIQILLHADKFSISDLYNLLVKSLQREEEVTNLILKHIRFKNPGLTCETIAMFARIPQEQYGYLEAIFLRLEAREKALTYLGLEDLEFPLPEDPATVISGYDL